MGGWKPTEVPDIGEAPEQALLKAEIRPLFRKIEKKPRRRVLAYFKRSTRRLVADGSCLFVISGKVITQEDLQLQKYPSALNWGGESPALEHQMREIDIIHL